MLYKIERVDFNKAFQSRNYKAGNRVTKKERSRALHGYFSMACGKSFNLSQRLKLKEKSVQQHLIF